MGDVVSLPKKLKWEAHEYWVGHVTGTQLRAEVQHAAIGWVWRAWNASMLVNTGVADDLEQGKELAKAALEKGILVVHLSNNTERLTQR
jgi:hypothetical protein